jgi:hypothetical protein
MNRDTGGFGGVYTLMNQYDYEWIEDIDGITDPETTDVDRFVDTCLRKTASYIVYNYATQQALIPSLITLAAVMNAPLVEASYIVPDNSVQIYNAAEQWSGFTPLQATQYVYENYINSTTTLAWMNPGYDNAAKPSNPPLTKDPHLGLTDFVVKERIFTFYLNNACIPKTDESDFMFQMTTSNPWPRYLQTHSTSNRIYICGMCGAGLFQCMGITTCILLPETFLRPRPIATLHTTWGRSQRTVSIT